MWPNWVLFHISLVISVFKIFIKKDSVANYTDLVTGSINIYWWDLTRMKHLSMAAIQRVMWLCACVRFWPNRGDMLCEQLLLMIPWLTWLLVYYIFHKVTTLVKKVNCQFTFGVFTKLDELVEIAQNDNVDVDFLRQHCEEGYKKAVDGKGEVHFVSVKCVENHNVSLLFTFCYYLVYSTYHSFLFSTEAKYWQEFCIPVTTPWGESHIWKCRGWLSYMLGVRIRGLIDTAEGVQI